MCPSFMNLSVSHKISLPSCPSLLQASNGISFLYNLKRYLIHTQASMYKLFLLLLYKGKPTLYTYSFASKIFSKLLLKYNINTEKYTKLINVQPEEF